jgi:hypothetical protein
VEKKNTFTKGLAAAGTIFVWLPILAPVIFSLELLIANRIFRFDYLMPAELFPLILLGSGLLLWAAIRAKSHVKLISWSLVSAVSTLVLSQAVAVVTGIASGRTAAAGIFWILILILFALFFISTVILAIGGSLLTRDLFRT